MSSFAVLPIRNRRGQPGLFTFGCNGDNLFDGWIVSDGDLKSGQNVEAWSKASDVGEY